jgi:hypothetical protein
MSSKDVRRECSGGLSTAHPSPRTFRGRRQICVRPQLHIGVWTITLDRFHYYHRFEFGRRRRDRCNEKLATATRHESTCGFHASGNDPLFVFAVQQADCKTTNGDWVT